MKKRQRTNINILLSVLLTIMAVVLLSGVFYLLSGQTLAIPNNDIVNEMEQETSCDIEESDSDFVQDYLQGGVFLASDTDSETSYTYNGVTYTTSNYIDAEGQTLSYTGTQNMSSSSWSISNGVYYATGTANTGGTAGINITGTVTLVLYNCNITTTSASPIHLNSNANVTIIVLGTCTMTAGLQCAGIHVPDTATLTLAGNGHITATGGNGDSTIGGVQYRAGAGIGGNGKNYNDCGTIIIDGDVTVVAIGGNGDSWGLYYAENAAGIGGGGEGSGGTITITGNAVVTATAGSGTGNADAIGSGGDGSSNGGLSTSENAVVYVDALPSSLITDLTTNDGGIVIVGDTATIYGDFTFTEDYVFPDNVTNIVIADSAEKPVEITISPGVEVDLSNASGSLIGTVTAGDSEIILKVSDEEGVEDGKLIGYYETPDGEPEIDTSGNVTYPLGSIQNPYDEDIILQISVGNIFIGSATYEGETLQRFYQSKEVDEVVIDDELNDSLSWIYVKSDKIITITGTSEYSNVDGVITKAYVIEVVRGTHTIAFDNLHIIAYENPPLEVGTYYNEQTDAVDTTLNLVGENYLIAGGENPAIKYGEQSSLTIEESTNIAENYLIATSAGDYVVLDSKGESETSAQMMKMTFIEAEQVNITAVTELMLERYDSSGNLTSTNYFELTPEQVETFAFKSIALTLPSTEDGSYYKVYSHGVEIYAVTDAVYEANKDNPDYDYSNDYISEFSAQNNAITKYWLATSVPEEEFKVIEGAYYRRINLVADISAMASEVSDITYDGVVTVILKTADMVLDENGNLELSVQGTIPAGTKMTIVTFGVYDQVQGCNSYTLESDLTNGILSSAEFKNIVGQTYEYSAANIDIKLVLDFENTDLNSARSAITLSFVDKSGANNAVEISFKEQHYEREISSYLCDSEGTELTELQTQKSSIDGYTGEDSYIIMGNDVSFQIEIITADLLLPVGEDIGYVVIFEFLYFVSDNVQIALSSNSEGANLECAVFGKEVIINGFTRDLQVSSDGTEYMLADGMITFFNMPAGDYMVTAKIVKKVEVYEKFGEEIDWVWYYPETTDTSYCNPIFFTVNSPILVVERDESRIIDVTKSSVDLEFAVQKSDTSNVVVTIYLKDETGKYVILETQWEYRTEDNKVIVTIPKNTQSGTYRIEFSTSDACSVYYNIVI